ncbi:MAG TPA: hypothetical protein PKE31_19230, partial [Pseudomonadota bacterium]|nr:hypothetical protein [Pseudomonadota bacterium]
AVAAHASLHEENAWAVAAHASLHEENAWAVAAGAFRTARTLPSSPSARLSHHPKTCALPPPALGKSFLEPAVLRAD